MKIGNVQTTQKSLATTASKIAFKGTTMADKKFDEYAPKKLPEGKAIQISRKPGIGGIIWNIISMMCVLGGGIGVFARNTHQELKLIDIDPNNLTEKQQKLIKKGKLINFVPRGYHIEGDKVKKNK